MRDAVFFARRDDRATPRAVLLSIVSSSHITPGSTLTVRAGDQSVTLTFVNRPTTLDEIAILPRPSRQALELTNRLRVLAPWLQIAPEANQPPNNLRLVSRLGVVEVVADLPGLLTMQPILADPAQNGSAAEPGGDFRLFGSGDLLLEGTVHRLQTAVRVRVHTSADRTLLGGSASPEQADTIATRLRLGLERDGFFPRAEVIGTIDTNEGASGTGIFAIRVPAAGGSATSVVEGIPTQGFRFL